ncbi:MAG: NAD(P)H-hydrate dehydratase [Chitinophagales bacterium]
MRLVTPAEMRLIERRAESEFGLASVLLMENAGARAAEVALRLLGGEPGKVVVVAGKGANGGDGFVLARHLVGRGRRVEVFLCGRAADLRGEAAANFAILERCAGERLSVCELGEETGLGALPGALREAGLVVDALFGTGLHGRVTGFPLRVIEAVNAAGRPVLALDVPSGVDAATGQLLAGGLKPGEAGGAVRATATVTFGLPKLGLFLYPGAAWAGEVVAAHLGLPPSLLAEEAGPTVHLITPERVRAALPARPVVAHKGSFGHVLIVGGSPGLTGAVALAGEAALRGGAGKVTVAIPRSLNPILEVKLTEAMSLPLPETAGQTIAAEAAGALAGWAGRCTAVGLGVGMGTSQEAGEFLRQFLTGLALPVVLDADALRLLAARPELFRALLADRPAPAVLTPHPGEMAALMGETVDAVERSRVEAARAVARSWGVILALKGAHTVVAAPGGEVFVNPTGNPGLATGGTGDVLTGLVTALLAQGVPPAEAAVAGVYLHGLAGDLAAEAGPVGVVAGEVARCLPRAHLKVLRPEKDAVASPGSERDSVR